MECFCLSEQSKYKFECLCERREIFWGVGVAVLVCTVVWVTESTGVVVYCL